MKLSPTDSHLVRCLFPVAMLMTSASLPGCLSDTGGDPEAAPIDSVERRVSLLAVEWKGGVLTAAEPYPGDAGVPAGRGYGIKPPDENGRWEVNAYRWDPGVVVVRTGETITLTAFGVNGALHVSEVEGHDVRFNVTRGTTTEVAFVAGPPGIYRIVCRTHEPSMEASLVVLPAS